MALANLRDCKNKSKFVGWQNTFVIMPTGGVLLSATSFNKRRNGIVVLLYCFNENQLMPLEVCLREWYCACIESLTKKTEITSGQKKTSPLV
jgi:hypothetical protein